MVKIKHKCTRLLTINCIYLFLSLMISATHAGNPMNVGTTLYRKRDLIQIWSEQDAIRLQGRMIVDQLLPRQIPDGATFIKYVKLIMEKTVIIDSEDIENYTKIMVADVIGGYMHSVLLFKVKATYYEGHVDFNVTSWLFGTMRKIKFVLNTDGRGWRTVPRKKVQEKEEEETKTGTSSLAISTTSPAVEFNSGLDDNSAEDFTQDSCAMLRPEGPPENSHAVMVVPMPAFDDDRWPGSLVLPFSAGQRLFSIDATTEPSREESHRPSSSQPPLVRYYRLAVRCVSAAPDRFLRDVRRWLDTSAAPLLENRHRWYPVLAGASYVIRAAAIASGRQAHAGRGAVGRAQLNATAVAVTPIDDDDNNDDNWGTCDDGGRLPNVNVFLLAVLLSLAFVWTGLGVLRGHKAVRFVFGPLAACLRHTVQ